MKFELGKINIITIMRRYNEILRSSGGRRHE